LAFHAPRRYLCGVEPNRIKAFIDAMAASDLDELEFSQDGWTLRLVRRGAGPAAEGHDGAANANAAACTHHASAGALDARTGAAGAAGAQRSSPPAAAASHELTSPLFGIVHLQQTPGEPAFVRVGERVEAGRTLCVVEAMKVFNEVCADRDGTVVAVLVASGQEVDAGQPLFRFA
jgi:acetyl-CoA carboxylase biotin carboxyl carrier protein